jgi:hypothetical protein
MPKRMTEMSVSPVCWSTWTGRSLLARWPTICRRWVAPRAPGTRYDPLLLVSSATFLQLQLRWRLVRRAFADHHRRLTDQLNQCLDAAGQRTGRSRDQDRREVPINNSIGAYYALRPRTARLGSDPRRSGVKFTLFAGERGLRCQSNDTGRRCPSVSPSI